MENLTEQLRLEQLEKRQTAEKMSVMKAHYEQQISQRDAELKSDTSSETSNSPAEEMLIRRRLRGKHVVTTSCRRSGTKKGHV